jgi:hypothetical protein
MPEELTPYQIFLRARLSSRYHQQRRRVLLRRAKMINYLITALSLGMVASVLQDAPLFVQVGIPFLVALATLADTVFGFTPQAYEHLALYRRWAEFEQWLLRHPGDPAADPREAMARLAGIEADEPPVNRAAADLCDNELLIAQGHDSAHRVGPFRRVYAMI